MSEFSFYTSTVEPGKAGHKNNEVLNLDKLFALITGPQYRDCVEKIRKVHGKAEQDKLKKALHYFTVSGVFKPGTRKSENIIWHSGFMQIDFDAKDNPGKTSGDIKSLIKDDPYLSMIFISPTGSGTKAIAKIPADVNLHRESFTALENHFKKKYDLVIDKQCKDISRPFFVSYDPDAIKKDAIEIALPPGHKDNEILNVENDFERKIRHIEKLCELVEKNAIDITFEHENYFKIGFAIADGLGESGREYFHRIAKFYVNPAKGFKYNRVETDKQYDACKKTGKVKWPTVFGIASDFGIVLYPSKENNSRLPKANLSANGVSKNHISNSKEVSTIKFWTVRNKNLDDGTKQFKDVVIADLNLLELLKSFGYRRYDIEGGGYSFVEVKNNIVCEVQPQNIQDSFSRYLKTLPEKIEPHVTRYDLESMVVKQSEKLFGKARLTWLISDEQINFNKDNKNESYAYYANGFVKCVKGDFSFQPYSSLQKSIWKSQLKQRDFVKLADVNDQSLTDKYGCYAKFILNVAGNDLSRFESLLSLIGYLLHDFKDTKLKAVVLTDSKLSEGNNGRTGKTLFGKGVEHIRDVCELNGKEFKADKSFKYQEAGLSTQIVFLNDAMKKFNLETLYNDITEGITIEKKNQSPVKLKVKYLITTNATLKTEGASSKDRVTEFEFSDHYSDKFHPKDEFGHWFFTEWEKDEWNLFDNFMMFCICFYLENGLIEPDPVNLNNRKLIDQSCKQFYDFIEARNVQPGVEFIIQDAHEEFQSQYPDYEFYGAYPIKKFARWLKLLPELHLSFKDLSFERCKKSNDKQSYIFKENSV